MVSDFSVFYCALSRVFAYRCAAGRRLIECLGGPDAVFSASREELAAILPGGAEYIDRLRDPALIAWAQREVDWARGAGIRLLGLGEAEYPQRLAACDDAPLLLYCKGSLPLEAPRVLAVVGTRKCSWQGREACRRMVGSLAGLDVKPVIVSGLALGIDGCAHAAALENGLPTVAVLPCGLDEVYPRQHSELAGRIAEHGALVSDFARGTEPAAFTFLRRNRIIAGLADATLLVESYRRGGGLLTMSLAASYNRDTFAVPGRLSDASFAGCNRLIERQEAILVSDAETIPRTLGWASSGRKDTRQPLLRPDDPPRRREVLRLLQERAPLTTDEVSALLGLGAEAAAVELYSLELEGRVGLDGNKFFLPL